jgi:hypothetical protein
MTTQGVRLEASDPDKLLTLAMWHDMHDAKEGKAGSEIQNDLRRIAGVLDKLLPNPEEEKEVEKILASRPPESGVMEEAEKKIEAERVKQSVFGENDETNKGIVMGLQIALDVLALLSRRKENKP